MDNKITKQRLSDFFSYEWIAIILAVIIGIVACNFVFNFFEVKPTTGQRFRVIYDENIEVFNEETIYPVFDEAFSYDVLDWQVEKMYSEYNVLSVREETYDVDVLFTDSVTFTEAKEVTVSRAWSVIDGFSIIDYKSLCEQANEYLLLFLKDAYVEHPNELDLALEYKFLDVEKIDKHFERRALTDNRFRTKAKMDEGKLLERERIAGICKNVQKMKYLLSEHEELFLYYTKYEQALNRAVANNDTESINQINDWIAQGKGNAPYGLCLEKLVASGDKLNVSNFFKVKNSENSKDVVLMVFDMAKVQSDLQYESIAFAIKLVESCSDLLDGVNFN